jgi:signal transduction histidine kinase
MLASSTAGGTVARALEGLRAPLDHERRSILPIQIVMRWALFAAALVIIVYEPRSSGLSLATLIAGTALAGGTNAVLHWRLVRGLPISLWLPALSSVVDAAAITIGLRLVEGFDNLSFALYYPALLALTLVFPGRWSLVYAAGTMTLHTALVVTHHSFDTADVQDVKDLAVRLTTLAVTVAIANLAVTIERRLRARAVNAALAAQIERQRVSREVHDGVAQGVYMLALNLEANAKVIEEQTDDEALRDRMGALVRLSKQTLLETRSLLVDLQPALAGEEGLASLVEQQAGEFSAVTGIEVSVDCPSGDVRLPPATLGEVYRVLQEGLANVYKHAGADSAALRLERVDGALRVELADDGAGFDPAEAGGGHGLANLRERAAHLGGALVIDSAPGRGTRLELTFPLEAAAASAAPAGGVT